MAISEMLVAFGLLAVVGLLGAAVVFAVVLAATRGKREGRSSETRS